MSPFCLKRLAPLVAAASLTLVSPAAPQTARPGIADGIQQIRSGDPFRAVLTLNDVVTQNAGDAGLVARAHAVSAMAHLAMNQPERARAAALQALAVQAGFVPNPEELNAATIALFKGLRGAPPANPEAEAQASEKAGQFQQAFLSYLGAYQALPTPAPREDDRRLRERIIRVVQKLPATPVIPQDARDHARNADQLLETEAILSGSVGASSQMAVAELTQAIRIAPWWPEATFKLASVLQKLGRVEEAVINLNLYKLADPQGFTAAAKTNAPAAGPAPVAAAPAAAAPAAAPAAFGTVHIYRRYNYVGSSGRAKVDCDGLRMAELQNRRVVTFKVPVGSHAITVHDDTFTLDVSAGQEYYFKSTVGFSFSTRPVPADEGRAEVKEHGLKPNEPKRTTSTQCTVPTAPQPKR